MPDTSRAQFSLQHFTLANGLKVYLREDHRAPLVSVQLWYHVGSSYEPEGHSGLSHALEHLMFEGSSKLAAGEYFQLMSRLGGDPNAYTFPDATVYPVTLPASRMEVALEAMADAMATATLSEAPFERELAVVMAERRVDVDNKPFAAAVEQHKLLAHGKSGYATPTVGFRADLQQLTQAAALSWYQRWYHPNNATLAVVGAAHPAQLRTLVERHFGAIPAHPLPIAPLPRHDQTLTRRTQSVRIEGLREGLIMSFNCPSLATADDPTQAQALRLIPELLTQGASARLQRSMVAEQPLLQGVKGGYDLLVRGDGLLTFSAFNDPAKATPEQAQEQLLREISALRLTPPTAAELQRAKAQLMAREVFARDDIAKQADMLGRMAACGLDPTELEFETTMIEGLTDVQVCQAVEAFLSDDRLTTTFMSGMESHDE